MNKIDIPSHESWLCSWFNSSVELEFHYHWLFLTQVRLGYLYCQCFCASVSCNWVKLRSWMVKRSIMHLGVSNGNSRLPIPLPFNCFSDKQDVCTARINSHWSIEYLLWWISHRLSSKKLKKEKGISHRLYSTILLHCCMNLPLMRLVWRWGAPTLRMTFSRVTWPLNDRSPLWYIFEQQHSREDRRR